MSSDVTAYFVGSDRSTGVHVQCYQRATRELDALEPVSRLPWRSLPIETIFYGYNSAATASRECVVCHGLLCRPPEEAEG